MYSYCFYDGFVSVFLLVAVVRIAIGEKLIDSHHWVTGSPYDSLSVEPSPTADAKLILQSSQGN